MPKFPKTSYIEIDMTSTYIRASLRVMTQIMMTQDQVIINHVAYQASLGLGPQPQPNVSIPTSRIQYFATMNPPTLHGTKVNENPEGFIDEVFKVVDFMDVTPRKKEELDAYQLKDVAPVSFELWSDERPYSEGPVD